ncbi:TlpA disulfide reductase family protein [Winogradskyella forsetii]|uniref:TlpA disulfide reductase family protein n=1 Tax=Winogradskyella forsetii TaxID=2686077 RepID=UPI0015BED7C6|nr:TlpA disulfide reductase family protein [Winogradskyella forsetii]
MKKITLLAFLMLTILSCKNDKQEEKINSKTIGQLTISNEKPQPGETLEITYKNDNVTDAFYNYMVGTKNYPVDIDYEASENEIKGAIKIPDSADAIALFFKVGEDYDNNDKAGYIMPLYNEEGNPIPGSNSAAAFYSVRNGSFYGIEADPVDVAKAIKTEMDSSADLKNKWETAYLNLAYKNNKAEGKTLIDNYLVELNEKASKSEEDYTNLMNFNNTIGETTKSDSLRALLIEKFPNGTTANLELAKQFNTETDLDKKIAIFETYMKRNPRTDNFSDGMASSLAYLYLEKDDLANFDKYSQMMVDKNRRAYGLNNLAWSYAEKGEQLDVAEKLSKESLSIIEALQKDPNGKPDYATQRNYEKGLESSYSMFADTYALIQFKQGNVKEAITYQEKAHDPKAQDAEANARYISYLMADEQYESVLDKAAKFIKLGNGNEDVKAAYKKAYLNVSPSAKDVNEKLAALEKEGYNKSVADIRSKMIDEAAPQFTLKDTEGKDIALNDLKGKIVILDFWATWCGPCKASFPGMQKVVTTYKDDENVTLLFVDTFESGANKEQLVEDFISENKYDFHVVYDIQPEGSTRFEVADKYEVTGIPTKIIIGPDGKIKFRSVGYNGSTDKLIDEMDIMIDILKS